MSSEKIIKTIRYLIYAIVILIPLIYFPTGIFPFQVIKTVVLQILVEIIFVLWLGLAIFHKEYRPRLTPVFLALIIFIIIVSLSSIFGVDWRISLFSDEARTLGLVALGHFFALFLVLSSIYGHRKSLGLAMSQNGDNFWNKLFFLSFGTAVMVSLIGISQKFLTFPKDASVWLHILYPEKITERVGSTFSNSAFMAGYLLFNFFIGLYLFASRKTRMNTDANTDRHRYIRVNPFSNLCKSVCLIIDTILITIAIFLSQTIGVILGLGVGIFVLLVYFTFKKPLINADEKLIDADNYPHKSAKIGINQRLVSTVLLILIIIFSITFTATRHLEIWQKIPGLARIAQASFETASIRDRLITWQISLRGFKEKPLLGWGFENFRIPFNKYYDPKILTKSMSGTYWDKPHNVLLEYLTTTGVLGLLAYLGIFGAAFYLFFKKHNINIRTSDVPNLDYSRPIIAALLIAYFTQNLFIFDTIGTYLMFFLILGFINSYFSILRTSDVPNIKTCDDQNIDNLISGHRKSKTLFIGIIIFLLLLSLFPIYYNIQIFNASRHEYWGINYFLNQLPESSLVSFSRAVATPTPYRDDIRKNFADVLKQAYQQDIQYPRLPELQGKLVEYLKLVIKRHPKDFFNYITLAEFENIFYQYNQNYLKEAEELSQKALELSPKRQQIYYVLAKTKLLEGDTYAAYKIFEEVIELNPQAADPHFLFGLMAYGIGDSKKGASEIAEAERLGRGPQKIDELIVLGNFVGDYEHDYKKAIGYYHAALFKYSQLPRANPAVKSNILLKLAVAYYFGSNYEQSRQRFSELKKLIDLRQLPIYPELQPVLQELGIDY